MLAVSTYENQITRLMTYTKRKRESNFALWKLIRNVNVIRYENDGQIRVSGCLDLSFPKLGRLVKVFYLLLTWTWRPCWWHRPVARETHARYCWWGSWAGGPSWWTVWLVAGGNRCLFLSSLSLCVRAYRAYRLLRLNNVGERIIFITLVSKWPRNGVTCLLPVSLRASNLERYTWPPWVLSHSPSLVIIHNPLPVIVYRLSSSSREPRVALPLATFNSKSSSRLGSASMPRMTHDAQHVTRTYAYVHCAGRYPPFKVV